MTFQLKELRRNYGLSQIQLADLLGTTQSTVSRWERGLEHMQPSKRSELMDIFSNRNGKLDPIIKQLAVKLPQLSVFDFSYNCLVVPQLITQHFRLETNEVIGTNYAAMVDTAWFSSVYDNVPLEERLYFEYERTMTIGSGGDEMPLSIRARQFFLQFEDSPGIMFAILQPMPPRDGLKVISKITSQTQELDRP